MRAVIYEAFGGPEVLRVVDDAPPPAPGRGEVLVQVHAAALNPKDVLIRKGKFTRFTGRRFPRTPGVDFAGTVLSAPVGSDLEPGAAVHGMIQGWAEGACAEQVAVPQGELAPLPVGLSMAEGAAVPLAALTALQALRDLLGVRPGQRVAINGASGGVGTWAVQIAAALGARPVAICSGRNAELVGELGAAEVLDYTAADPLAAGPFDAFFDVFGNRPWRAVRGRLARRGGYVTTVPGGRAIVDELISRVSGRRARLVIVRSNRADLEVLGGWLDAGTIRPVVDRVLPLDAVAEAHRYLETKRARGKVVLRVRAEEEAR